MVIPPRRSIYEQLRGEVETGHTSAGAGCGQGGIAGVVAMLGQVESAIVDVFRKGGGVDYSAFERFHALMAESSQTTLRATLLTRTLPLVPGLVDRLEAGIDVLDMGCGQGVAIRMMAERFPRSRFVAWILPPRRLRPPARKPRPPI